MTTTKLPDTVHDAQLLILDGLHAAHHFLHSPASTDRYIHGSYTKPSTSSPPTDG